jgi:hypothetical protein
MAKPKHKETHGSRPATQLGVLRDVMLSAAECGAWLTLHELSRLTHFGEASISAQLRNLRKPECGGFLLKKRLRRGALIDREEGHVVVWEYQLTTYPRNRPSRGKSADVLLANAVREARMELAAIL